MKRSCSDGGGDIGLGSTVLARTRGVFTDTINNNIIITNALEQGTLQVNGAVGRWQSIGDSLSDVRPRGLCEDEVLSPLKLRGFIRKLILVPAQSMKKKNHLVALRGRFNPIENEKISKSPNTTLTQ